MLRRTIILAFAFLGAIPALANTVQFSAPQSAAGPARPVLRLMNDTEFAAFLGHLDADLVLSQHQLEKMDLKSLSPDPQEQQDLQGRFDRSLQSLENTREEIQKLSQKQTLKLDLFLLIDLNELARSLDALDEALVNPTAINGADASRRSLLYAKEVLSMDVSLSTETTAFQHHFIAFTGVIDAALDQPEQDLPQPDIQK